MQQKKYRFIGCEIIYREACKLAATCKNRVDVEFLQKGLHDLETQDMVAKVQSTIDATDPDAGYDAILLGYARCNDGLVGVAARDIPLVLPRAHDCITFFFGSREKYREYFENHPGTYYLTTGWAERNAFENGRQTHPAYGREGVMDKLGLAGSYEELVAQYGEDNAKYIWDTLGDWKKNYTDLCYIEMGVCDESTFIEDAKQRAQDNHWAFEHRKGDWTLLEKLFSGNWDNDFLVVPPGKTIRARNDETIVDTE